MEPRLLFLILVGIAIGLSCLAGYWRKKAGEAAFAAALLADKAEDRDRHCRLAVMAGHRDACRMFCFAHPDFYEDRHPLKPFRFRGISVTFYGHYYPSRYKRLLDEEQPIIIRHATKGCLTKNSVGSAVLSMPSKRERTTA